MPAYRYLCKYAFLMFGVALYWHLIVYLGKPGHRDFPYWQ